MKQFRKWTALVMVLCLLTASAFADTIATPTDLPEAPVSEETEPVEEQPVEEEPAEEEPAAEEPVEEQPVEEAPAAEEPVEGQPVKEEPVEEEPVEEEPAEEEPVEEEPVEEEPVEEESVEEEPVEEKPIEEEPAEEQPIEEPVEEPTVEEAPIEDAVFHDAASGVTVFVPAASMPVGYRAEQLGLYVSVSQPDGQLLAEVGATSGVYYTIYLYDIADGTRVDPAGSVRVTFPSVDETTDIYSVTRAGSVQAME